MTLSLMACAGLSIDAPRAQTTPEALPPVVVKAPKKQTIRAKRTKAPAASPVAAQPVPLTDTEPRPKTETATGPVEGIVATRSATGTKTDTPLLETPQSISVITADRVHQQAATSVSDALGYTAGVRANVYGDDTRFDWLSIRGFDAYLPGFFVDGMLARNNNTWSVWKVEPYGQERIEVLKGPPSVLYGQANVGGMVNVISKRPLDEPFNEGMTASAWKTSAGAAARLPIAQTVNLTRQLKAYQDAGCMVVGLAADGDISLPELVAPGGLAEGPLVVVVGSEGKGLGRLVAETCDQIVSIPMVGQLESLNAGVAASVALYAISQARA